MTDSVVINMPVKTTKIKYRRTNIEIVYNPDNLQWEWFVVVNTPSLYKGEATTSNRALAQAKKAIDKMQGDD